MNHPRNPGYKPGDHWNVCQRCGFDMKQSESKKEWTGLIVCKDCWEPRHPQDFVRGRPENTTAKGLVTSKEIAEVAYAEAGDANQTLTVGTDKGILNYSTTLTANRTVTLDTTGAIDGSSFTITATHGSAYTIDVGGLYTIPASTDGQVIVQYNGTAWFLVSATLY